MRIHRSLFTLLLGSCLVTGLSVSATPIPEACQTGGIALGCQAYTFRSLTLLETIDKTAVVGGKVIEIYPGQKFSVEKPDLKFDHNATEEMIAIVKDRLQKAGVRAVNYGVVGIPKDEAGARKIFEFAKTMGLYGITTEAVDALDVIEKLAKEYDVRVGIHNHPRRMQDASYKVWDPNYVLSVVKNRDSRIGACADVGHWIRSGLNPVESLKVLQGRIVSVHLKDLNEKSPKAHDVPYGTGISDVPAMIAELKRQNFAGNASIEYEYNTKDLSSDVAQCIGFMRGFGAK